MRSRRKQPGRAIGRRIGSDFSDASAGVRFVAQLVGYLRHPVGEAEARAILPRRLASRAADFLSLVEQTVYSQPRSPYRALLESAGCEPGDLRALVTAEGVEGALQTLFRAGVYLTVDELKGRQEVVRGSTTLRVDLARLRNPLAAVHVMRRTGGSRDAPVPIPLSLGHRRDHAVNLSLFTAALGASAWTKAIWGVPGSAAMVLLSSGYGQPPARWFVLVDPGAAGLHRGYRWSVRLLRLGGLLAGTPLPHPEYVPTDQALTVARWMVQVLRTGGVPFLWTFPSSAVRLCRDAAEAGYSLGGARFLVMGEPLTPARRTSIRASGAEAFPVFGSTESGMVAYACLAPAEVDELHVLSDVQALIQPGSAGASAGLPTDALLTTSLRVSVPLILLNASLGDRGVLTSRACGCGLDSLGWDTHLHTVRSFEKLTTAGMTFLDSDIARVLDEVLPTRFGGGPTDYQLVETEEAAGQPRLVLRVHPAVGEVNEDEIIEAFLTGIGGGSMAERVMELHWRRERLARVERRAPLRTAAGKILHLHHDRAVAGT